MLKTFFYSLKKSLFEPKYYKDVAKASFGFSFKYLWFLLFLLTVIKAFTLTGEYLNSRPKIKPGIDEIMQVANNFYPEELKIKIINGQLSTNVQEPYIFEYTQQVKPNDKHLIIIDTKGSIENYPYYNTIILATKNAAVYPSKSSNGKTTQTSVFYFKDIKQNVSFDRQKYDDIIKMVSPYTGRIPYFIDIAVTIFLFLFLIFGSLFWTIGVMFGLLFLTFFIWIINLIFKKKYNYDSLYKMGMHAITWSILVSEALGYFRSPVPKLYSIIFLILMLFILFSQKETKSKIKS